MRRLVALAALLLVPAALAGSAASPGVTSGSILIGGISDDTAGGAALTRSAAAYFRHLNERGGVNGRTIEYRVLDGGSDPVVALEDAQRLVQQDKVFALFATAGTGTNLAIRDFLNRSGVPQLFVASGAARWGADARRYPWTIGYAPSFRLEGTVLGRQLAKTRPGARIAVLYADDEDGRELLAGLRRGLGARAGQIALAGYDPAAADVAAKVAELRATKADTLVLLAFGRFATGALAEARRLGWRPQVYVHAGVSASVALPGAVSTVYVESPANLGTASAFTLVDTLRKAGQNLTRAGVMAAARSLTEANNPFLLPGIVVKTSRADAFPIEQVALQRWSGGRWEVFTGPLTTQ
jgi:branched-chain amino acid transport system substrate-binding protein